MGLLLGFSRRWLINSYSVYFSVHSTACLERESEREREREMAVERNTVLVRADMINDLKRLDEELSKHLSRVWMMKHKVHNNNGVETQVRIRVREDWEIDVSKLVVKEKIGRGTFGSIHRGFYDGKDVAGTSIYNYLLKFIVFGLSSIYHVKLFVTMIVEKRNHRKRITHGDDLGGFKVISKTLKALISHYIGYQNLSKDT